MLASFFVRSRLCLHPARRACILYPEVLPAFMRTNAVHNRTFEPLIFCSLSLAVFLAPLLYVPTAFQPYTLPKLAFLALMAVFMLVFWAAGVFTGELDPKVGGVMGALVGAFTGLAFISYQFSWDKISGLYGHFPRHDGWLTYAVLAAVFFSAIQVDWGLRLRKFLAVLVAGASVTALVAIAQYFGLIVLGGQPQDNRVASTLGNPVFLGVWLAMAFICAVVLALAVGKRSAFWALPAALILASLVLTVSRSALAGAVVGLGVLALFRSKTGVWRWRRGAILALTSAVPVLGLLVASPLGESLRASLRSGSLESAVGLRVEFAAAAFKIIRAYPLFGVGPSNFPWANQFFQSAAAVRLQGIDWRFDDAHNFGLQIGASLGLPALAAFLAVVGLFFFQARRAGALHDLVGAPTAAVAAFLTAAMFEPAGLVPLALFWVFVAVTAGSAPDHKPPADRRPRILAAVIGLSAALLFGLFFLLIKMTVADVRYAEGLVLKSGNSLAAAAGKVEEAVRLAPQIDRYYFELGDIYLQRSRQGEGAAAAKTGLYYFNQSVRRGRLDPQNWISLALAYQHTTERFRQDYKRQARAAAARSVELAPTLPAAHRAMGAVLLHQGRLKPAMRHLRTAVVLDPNYYEGWRWLGAAYERLGLTEKAIEANQRAGGLK